MRTHQQGKAEAEKLHTSFFSAIVVLIMLFGAAISLLRIAPAMASTSCGQVLVKASDWLGGNGVAVRSNGADMNTGNECDPDGEVYNLKANPPQYGFGWVCVELVNRLYVTKGWSARLTIPATYNGQKTYEGAKWLYTLAAAGYYPNLVAHANGSNYKPVPGDMIVHSNGTYGHVTVVDYISGNTLHAVDQNRSANGWESYTYNSSTGAVSMPKVTISGYVHSTKNKSSAGGGGKLDWRYQTGNVVFSSPTVVNGVVYVGSYDDYVYALNASTGALLWRYHTGYSVFSSPAVVNGVVYVSSFDGYVYALNASNGTLTWRYQIGNYIMSSPAVVNGVVYVGSDDDYVYALNANNGSLLWRYQTGYSVLSSPAVVNGVVYVGSEDDYVYALNASTGALLWRYQTGNAVFSSPAVVNGVVYVGSDDDYVYALNASSGGLLWRYLTGFWVRSSPTVVNGVVYVGSFDGYVYALNASTGALLWRYQTGYSSIPSSPAVVNGVVYVGSDDGYVYALNASNGTLTWRYQTGNQIESSPAVVNGVAYVGSGDDYVYALTA